jgi:3-isopropylmalate/(R)-2-methylmalate dehydratase small subunit
MQAFTKFTGLAVPLNRVNVDTDQIIPKQFLKSIARTGFGVNLFFDWRYEDSNYDKLNKSFPLNQQRYQGAEILLAKDNFGCGSSREHAPWALMDYGIRAIIAPSYADIFYNNSLKNGLLPVELDAKTVNALFAEVEANEGCKLTVDLEAKTVTSPGGIKASFEINEHARNNLLKGLDDIGLTLEHDAEISAYEQRRAQALPWLP